MLLLLALLVCPPSPVDHMAVAVRSLDDARVTYGNLGFRLKQGRVHANGLNNAFAKFESGDYLELITPERGANDALTTKYVQFLERGEGPAFLALKSDDVKGFRRCHPQTKVQRHGKAFDILTFDEPNLDWLFVIEYLDPVADDPALFDHPNTAVGIDTVWIAVARYEEIPHGDPAIRPRLVADDSKPIVGVTLSVRSIEAARGAIRLPESLELAIRIDERGRSFIVPPGSTHGLWIEFLERN
ncbi:MAG TPA: VOC family protein [Thermoanaerobaculia bacterium]